MTWPRAKVGDVLTLKYGKALKAEDRDGGVFPVVGSGGVAGSHSASLTGAPAIVLGRKGSIGSLTYLDTPCWPIDTAYYVEVDQSRFDLRWIYWAMGSLNLGAMNKSAAVPGLNRDDVYRLELSTPPLPEQRRIASILDESQRVIDSRGKQLQLLDELESEMYRSSMANADSTTHSKVPLKDLVANLASGKSIVGSDNDAGEFRVLKISAVTSGEFMANQAKPLPAGYVPLDGHLVREGDVLMSRANTAALVGATAMVRESVRGLALPDKLWRLEWRDAYRPFAVFFWRQLRSAGVRAAMSRMASGSGGAMKNLSQSDVLELELVVPPEALMRRFQEDWKALQSLRGQIAAHRRKAESAKRSLQARAFRGEL